MPLIKIILDTNSYLRLAKSLHPLLNRTFGKSNYCLFIIKDFQKEFNKKPILKSKFYWVNTPEFIENRKKPIKLSPAEQKQFDLAFEIVLDTAKDENLLDKLSLIDIKFITYSHILKSPLVTDDTDMMKLAKEFEIEIFNTLQLLKLMLDNNHITMEKIREIIQYLNYEDDLPKSKKELKKEYKTLFNEDLNVVFK
ncbi:hypothetical protein AMJ80_01690 [bacterium SM23_31]|nr:MAG: hypothetical protein AMJ80_01690 [bacterium SM23_31]